MKYVFKIKLTHKLLIGFFGFFFVSQASQAEIILVDTIDSPSITTTHVGGDTITLIRSTGENGVVQISGGYFAGHIGYDTNLGVFSSGMDLNPVDGSDGRSYLVSGVATNGAVAGLNYASMDLDVDGIYETVVEFNFGDSLADTTDDVITRYAYDNTGAYLRVTDAFLDGTPAPAVPVPIVEIEFTPASQYHLASVEIIIRNSVQGYDYTCFSSKDLLSPKSQWKRLWTQRGWGGVVDWVVGYSDLPDAHFFYVEVTRNEEMQNKVVEPTR